MLTLQAFNALLKTLEEPPAHVKFLFATTEPQKMPDTILSRCQRFDLRRILSVDIRDRLRFVCEQEAVEAEDEALLAVARGAKGGMRDALSALDQLLAFRGKQLTEGDVLSVFGLVSQRRLEDLSAAVLDHDVPALLDAIAEFDETGKDLDRVLTDLVIHMRNVLVEAYSPGSDLLNELPETEAAAVRDQAKRVDPSRVSGLVENLITATDRMRHSLSKRTLLETSLIAASRAARYATLDEVWREMEKLSGSSEGQKKK